MEQIKFYKDILMCKNNDAVFQYFIKNLKPSILLWSYFINWEKVFKNVGKIEIALNNFNYLIGKDNFDEEFRFLVKQNPEIIKIIPALVVRDGNNSLKFKILVDYKKRKFIYEDYNFDKKNPSDDDIKKYINFMEEAGLKDLIVSQKIKNLVDYMIGVEAGIDSNGRKNRGGHAMENIVEFFVKDLCVNRGFRYLKEVNAKKIKEDWGYDVPVDKSSRRYDFVINSGNKLFIIETNFYSGGGSKLKATAGEYQKLFDMLNGKYDFIWITDGLGWLKTQKSLKEAFDHNQYIFNLDMIEGGILESLIK